MVFRLSLDMKVSLSMETDCVCPSGVVMRAPAQFYKRENPVLFEGLPPLVFLAVKPAFMAG